MEVRRYLTGEGAYVERHYLNGVMQVVDEAVLKGEGTEVLPNSPAQVVKQSKKNKKKKKKKSKKIVAKILVMLQRPTKYNKVPLFAAIFLLQAAPGCHIIHGSNPPKWVVGMDIFSRRFWLEQ